MHSMVGSFSPYTVKRRRAELVRGYCYRFLQCSFPCGIVMLILSILLLIVGSSQLIYIIHFNGCNPTSVSLVSGEPTTALLASSTSWKCNRHTMKVLGITFVVTGAVSLLISALITKYSRSSEENNVIRTTTSSLLANTSKTSQNPVPQASSQYYHTPTSSINEQNNIVVSIR